MGSEMCIRDRSCHRGRVALPLPRPLFSLFAPLQRHPRNSRPPNSPQLHRPLPHLLSDCDGRNFTMIKSSFVPPVSVPASVERDTVGGNSGQSGLLQEANVCFPHTLFSPSSVPHPTRCSVPSPPPVPSPPTCHPRPCSLQSRHPSLTCHPRYCSFLPLPSPPSSSLLVSIPPLIPTSLFLLC